MSIAKDNYKKGVKDLKKELIEEKNFAKRRDNGLMDRASLMKEWKDGKRTKEDSQRVSLYDNGRSNGKDGQYTVFIEQDKHRKEAQYKHMTGIDFNDYDVALSVFNAIKKSKFVYLLSPATASDMQVISI